MLGTNYDDFKKLLKTNSDFELSYKGVVYTIVKMPVADDVGTFAIDIWEGRENAKQVYCAKFSRSSVNFVKEVLNAPIFPVGKSISAVESEISLEWYS